MKRDKNIFKIFIHNIRLVALLLNPQKTKVIIMIILSIVYMSIGITIPYVWGQITNGLFYGLQESNPAQNGYEIEYIITLIGILLVLYLLGFSINLKERLISTKVANGLAYTLREKLIQKTNYLSISNHEKKDTGDVLSIIINDIEKVSNITTVLFVEMTTTTTLLVASLVMMFIVQPILAAISIILIPICFILVKLIVDFSQGHYIRQANNLAKINSYTDEAISGLSLIYIFNKQESFKNKFTQINNKYCDESMKAQLVNLLTRPVLLLLENFTYIVSVVAGAILCVLGTLMIGDIVAFVQYLNKVITPLHSIMDFSNSMQSMAASAQRIFNYLEEENESDSNSIKKFINLNTKTQGPIIEFENVSFSYDGKHNVLENFNLVAYKGQTIAIVGPTGSGKTTIMKLLLKYYNNYSGKISVYNTNIKYISNKELRNQFAIVLQKVWVFYESILNNIKYGKRNAKDKEVISVSKLTSVDDFVKKMNENYITKISENGHNLSNGQKQLIAIARAFISNKDIIILDEATSSIDSNTEDKIYKAFDETIKNKTAIIIAHRLSTVKKADKIIVLNRGKIEEEGRHDELLNKQGFYYELYISGLKETNE